MAFLGQSGWGKSTIAAALAERGHGLVSDDVVAIADAAGRPVVAPGVAVLKLWPDTVEASGAELDGLARVHPASEKRVRRLPQLPSTMPLPLRSLYVLADGPGCSAEMLPRRDALMELVRHTYCARFLPELGAAAHFIQCAAIANAVPIRRLTRERKLTALDGLARLVEEDAGYGQAGKSSV
ncbi:MAG: hypothetical protein ACREON_11970 [Gemmatimonadaceae bacterium]